MDFTGFKYSYIKEKIDNLDLENISQLELNEIIAELEKDKRKNVLSLSKKLTSRFEKIDKERKRIISLYDNDLSYGRKILVAGVDEVGRGPLAGPICAAAVILELDVDDADKIMGINDSKLLSEEKRTELDKIIREKAIAFSISSCDNKEIDEKGIGYCNNKVFIKAVNGLNIKPDLVLSDGYLIKNFDMSNKALIKGDRKSASIACASIIAKVYRDNLMKEYAKVYTGYDFENNMGYGTKRHIEGINEHGICRIHRKSFLKSIL